MPRVTPVDRAALTQFKPMFDMVEAGMGFVPNSLRTMAHWPEMMQSMTAAMGTVLGGGEVDAGLKQLLAFVVSNEAGCRYCQAHTSHTAVRRGVSDEKLDAAFEYETSPLFSEAERAALRVAAHAGQVPNASTDEDFEALHAHFSEREIVEIVAVISLFGFLNRWNDTMATTLESSPLNFAREHLAGHGWSGERHQ